MRGAVCRWPFRAATDLLARRGAGENNKAVLPTRSRAKGTISARKKFHVHIQFTGKVFIATHHTYNQTCGRVRGGVACAARINVATQKRGSNRRVWVPRR